jgi:predicted glycoside hydrolase/deacetylase ChbG (UPF0249 family)
MPGRDSSWRNRILIVNADDLGRTLGINDGIFAAHRDGLVTSATLMVGYAAAEAAAAEARRYRELGIGLHVALTGGAPILRPELVPSLVDKNGLLPAKPEGHGDLDAGEVLAEVEAQLRRFRRLMGRMPTHLDSHHHSHRLPVVCEVLASVARRTDLPVRNASPSVGDYLLEAEVPSTDFFVEEFFGVATEVDDLVRVLTALAPGTTELMCHPAYVDDELRQVSSYADERARELATLIDPEVRSVLEAEEIRLEHFGTL